MKNIIAKPCTLLLMLAMSTTVAFASQPYTAADARADQDAEDAAADDDAKSVAAAAAEPHVDNSKNPRAMYSDSSRCESCDSIVPKTMGGLHTEIPYQHGKRNGMVKQWGHPGDGMAYMEVPVVDGKREGTMMIVTDNSYVIKVDYQDDSCLGGYVEYNPLGGKIATGSWFANRPYTAPGDTTPVVFAQFLELYPITGNTKSMTMRELDWPYRLHGSSTWYSDDGRVLGKAKYNHGKLVGKKICTDGRTGGAELDCL